MTDVMPSTSLRVLVERGLRAWRLVAYTTIAVLAASTFYAVTKERTYTASAAFMSQARGVNGSLNSLATQLGVGAGDMGSESPQFYVDFLSQKSTLRSLVDSEYLGWSGKGYRSLVEYFGVSGKTDDVKRDRAVEKLRRKLAATAKARTGVVTITMVSPDPVLARAVVDRAIALVNAFNLQKRKSQASAERDFVEQRLAQSLAELRAAENRQEQFLQTNAVVGSPRLRLEGDRLAQEVATRRTVYTTLSQSYEQARIDAVRDTPVITVIEGPVVAAEPDSRGVFRTVVSGLFVGLILGVLLTYWQSSWASTMKLDTAP